VSVTNELLDLGDSNRPYETCENLPVDSSRSWTCFLLTSKIGEGGGARGGGVPIELEGCSKVPS